MPRRPTRRSARRAPLAARRATPPRLRARRSPSTFRRRAGARAPPPVAPDARDVRGRRSARDRRGDGPVRCAPRLRLYQGGHSRLYRHGASRYVLRPRMSIHPALAPLLERIDSRTAVVGVLGLGYVGLPLASAFVEAGFPVLGFDTDAEKIELLARGENYVRHLGQEMTQRMASSKRFSAT